MDLAFVLTLNMIEQEIWALGYTEAKRESKVSCLSLAL